jgi:hypothetical protein
MQAPRDENRITTLLATKDSDGITPDVVYVNPTTHAIKIQDGLTGSDLSSHIASRDENRMPVGMAVSSVDGITPVALYIDASNKLLVQIN